MRRIFVLAALLFAFPASAQIDIELVELSFSDNACDVQFLGCYGAVAYSYQIGKYEVTNAQYAEFLNAVAATDTNALYHTNMGNPEFDSFGGITQSGSSPNFSYSAIAGREDMPVNWVSFWDATRLANWLHNGQPAGAQDNTTTEDGAYTLTPTGITNNTVTRNAGAKWFVTSEDEWYKAAYYNPGTDSYFDYPAGSDTQTTCTVPGATANTANCGNVVGDFTDVGSYTGSASPNGTFDQGGNVWEWNEDIIDSSDRGYRGSSFFNLLASSLGGAVRPRFIPSNERNTLGFRVASLAADHSIPVMSPAGLLVFAAGLLGFIGYYRRRF